MSSLGIMHYMIFAFVLFALGLIAVMSSKCLIKILFGIILMLNAVCLNFAALNVYSVHINHSGQIFSMFIMAVSAIEIAVVIVLFAALYKNSKRISLEDLNNSGEEI